MLASTLITQFESKQHDKRLEEIYVDPGVVDTQRTRYINSLREFITRWGDTSVEIISAPGRSEVCGNHTDHQRGMVLATSVNIDIIAICAKTEGTVVDVFSKGFGEIKVDLNDLEPKAEEKGKTESLIRGVASGIKVRDFNIGGFNAYITSQVPDGAGLSSSAAMEVLIGNIFATLHNNGGIKPLTIAVVGQEAENKYFGKPCGLMDQMACSIGGLIHIDFEQANAPKITPVDVDFDGFEYSMCIVDTKGSHADLTPDYAAITEEMKSVAKFFNKEVLREVDEKAFYDKLPEIREAVGDRAVLRAMHWFDEEKRVLGEVEALQDDNFTGFAKMVRDSGSSSYRFLQNAYTTANPAVQSLCIGVALTERLLGRKVGCRIHGGGFAGTIQVFVPTHQLAMYKEEIEKIFGEGACHVLKVRNLGGIKVV